MEEGPITSVCDVAGFTCLGLRALAVGKLTTKKISAVQKHRQS